jgi:hypothetical protein
MNAYRNSEFGFFRVRSINRWSALLQVYKVIWVIYVAEFCQNSNPICQLVDSKMNLKWSNILEVQSLVLPKFYHASPRQSFQLSSFSHLNLDGLLFRDTQSAWCASCTNLTSTSFSLLATGSWLVKFPLLFHSVVLDQWIYFSISVCKGVVGTSTINCIKWCNPYARAITIIGNEFDLW